MDKITWRDIIKSLNDSGMTYARIAEEIGVAASTVGDIATGRTKEPTGWAAVRLSRIYDKHRKREQRRAA